jgi:hypothetical protein
VVDKEYNRDMKISTRNGQKRTKSSYTVPVNRAAAFACRSAFRHRELMMRHRENLHSEPELESIRGEQDVGPTMSILQKEDPDLYVEQT